MGIDIGVARIKLVELGLTFQFGAFGTIIGFILSIVGIWRTPKHGDSLGTMSYKPIDDGQAPPPQEPDDKDPISHT
jgi:hypothetical protein